MRNGFGGFEMNDQMVHGSDRRIARKFEDARRSRRQRRMLMAVSTRDDPVTLRVTTYHDGRAKRKEKRRRALNDIDLSSAKRGYDTDTGFDSPTQISNIRNMTSSGHSWFGRSRMDI